MARKTWMIFFFRTVRLFLLVGLLSQAALVLASGNRPMPPSGIFPISPVPNQPAPTLPPVNLIPDTRIYNQLLFQQQNGAHARLHSAMVQEETAIGSGVSESRNGRSHGGTLFKSPVACLTFDDEQKWNGNIWHAAYGNWGTFAVDDGGFYRARNVRFDMERTIGPGDRAGSEFSFKISGDQPYAAGLVSPVIHVPRGAVVSVRARYLIYHHEGLRVGAQMVNDWVSLGLKPDAHGPEAIYVNGYSRGQWSEIANSVVAGESGEILVLLQAESPAAFNSNVYFDDIEISVDGMTLTSCE